MVGNRDMTIAQIVDDAAALYGNRIAVVDGQTRLSFADVRRLSMRLAKHFFRLGLRKGDRVGVQLPNNWHYVVTHTALARVGAVLTPLNLAYRQWELQYMLRHIEAKMVVVTRRWRGFDHLGLMNQVRGNVPSIQRVIVAGDVTPEGADELHLAALLERDPDGVSDQDVFQHSPDIDDLFAIMFTSGTESDPKATVHTYRTFVPGHILLAEEYQFSDRDVLLCLGSFSHMFSLPVIFASLRNGLRHVLLESYSPDAFLDLAHREGVTVAFGVPSMWLDILRAAEGRVDDPRLRLVVTGGSKIPPHMVHNLRKRFGCAVAAQWGMTELCAGAYTRPNDPPEKSWETVGRVCRGGELKILDEQRQPVPNGEVGELAFRGPSLFIEYYKNPTATAASFTEDGFFLTGDLCWMDDEQYIHFVGRSRDTINRGGLKIYATEIEDMLLEHPAIRQVAVVRMPDPRLGERPCAFVSLTQDNPITLEDITSFLLEKGVAKFKLPERLEIRAELPTTASGKIQKAKLIAELQVLED